MPEAEARSGDSSWPCRRAAGGSARPTACHLCQLQQHSNTRLLWQTLSGRAVKQQQALELKPTVRSAKQSSRGCLCLGSSEEEAGASLRQLLTTVHQRARQSCRVSGSSVSSSLTLCFKRSRADVKPHSVPRGF